MKLNKHWRILTVGDGDLSFSYALFKQFHPSQLVASVYDSENELKSKYSKHAFDKLKENQIPILTGFDVTNQDSWKRLSNARFDAVVFQFPLIPAFGSYDAFKQESLSVNTLNRRLLRLFIYYAHEYVLDKNGPMLCIITSKDVKPYSEWDIESSLTAGLDIDYLGQCSFELSEFPGYKIRNVDRDKHVKDTSGISYYWSSKTETSTLPYLNIPKYLSNDYCAYCRVGPFLSDKDKHAHAHSKKHKNMLEHNKNWQCYLSNELL